jgi:hypothetical protein
MSGKNPRLTPLESRKQLLIAESELNRAQLVNEWQTLAAEAHALTARAKRLGAIAAAVATLVAGVSAWAPKKTPPTAQKPSWWQKILTGVSLFTTFSQVFKSSSGEAKK